MKNSKSKVIDKIKKILSNKDIETHIDQLLKLEKQFPNDEVIKQAISQAYLRRNENTKALEYINLANEISPKNYAIKYNLGMMYKKFKKFDEAISFFKESIVLNREFKEGFNILGDIFYNKKDYQVSVSYYKKSINLDKTKNNVFALNRLAEISQILYSQKKDQNLLKNSKEYYEIIHKLFPNNDSVLQNIIKINNKLGRRKESLLIEKKSNGVFVINKSINEIKIKY